MGGGEREETAAGTGWEGVSSRCPAEEAAPQGKRRRSEDEQEDEDEEPNDGQKPKAAPSQA